ncbi:hypothetical protein FXO38_07644 [Capsicum annuum]|nr:hypothetical protein FXO38_07644 [Capsicum annuum]
MVALVGTHLQKPHGVWLDISSPICDVLISDSPPCRSNYAMVSFIPPVIRHKRILFRRWYTEKDMMDLRRMLDWVSKPARRIINRLLNPNPETRYGIEELMNTLSFKKSS